MNQTEVENPAEIARNLLEQGGFGAEPFSLQAMQGGRNNRVWRLEGGSFTCLLKRYYSHPSDPRNRLGTEVGYLKFLSAQGVSVAPRVLAALPEIRFSLLEYLPGRAPKIEDVTANHIRQASNFILLSNARRLEAEASQLPPASEAAFSLEEHLRLTQRRIDRLADLPEDDEIDREAKRFASGVITPLWNAIRERLSTSSKALAAVLEPAERCLSPSDFGFHNTLVDDTGTVRFVDFEYAGWDDPAKLICDFANQPDMLLCNELSQLFREAVIPTFSRPAALELRVKLLEPLYQLKWSCICLNLFFAVGKERHQFTNGNSDSDGARRAFQLEKARLMASRASLTFSQR